MRYKITVFAKITDFDYYCGEISETIYDTKITDFEINWLNGLDVLYKYILDLNTKNIGIEYKIGEFSSIWGNDVITDSNSFMSGFDKFNNYKEFEKNRIESNRIIRRKIKGI